MKKEQLIGLTVAKLAKEKEFSNGTSDVFIEYPDKSVEEVANYYTVNNLLACDMSSEDFTVFERPTQSLLQRWLREVHNIHIKIHSSNTDVFSYEVYEMIKRNTSSQKRFKNMYSKISYKSYEGALEIALKESLVEIKKYR